MKLINNNKICLSFLIIGVALAFFSLTPQSLYLEEEFGLPVLFQLRGGTSPPNNIVIVSVDEISSRILNLPDNPEKWPRSYYAELINKINQQAPSIIALNMMFGESKDIENDQLLAQSMTQGNNIILSSYLKQQSIHFAESYNSFKFERIIKSIPILEKAAVATAPFLLPKTSTTVKQFLAYKSSAGDVATFPVSIFQHYLLTQLDKEVSIILNQLQSKSNNRLLLEIDPKIDSRGFQKLKDILINNPQALDDIKKIIREENFQSSKKRLLNTWLSLLQQPDSLYFNHYGAAESIPTVPFYQALVSDVLNPNLFNNKIVLIGYSKTIEAEKTAGLYTVFSETNSDVTSPIELAATAVANLLENSWLKPLPAINQFLLIIIWSCLLIVIVRFFSYKQALYLLFLLTLTYLSVAYWQFKAQAVWLPLFIPLIIQAPLIVSFVLISQFFKGKQEHKNMQHAFSLYVPDNMVNSMAQQRHDAQVIKQYSQQLEGVCMATDAGQYTTLSENMEPQKLYQLINQYYGVMFPLVKTNKGIVSDVVGDAMFAIWESEDQDICARTHACIAALEIRNSVDIFNKTQQHPLVTRFGLNFGDFHLGNVGAAEHYEYRAVGDTVNTATRIEGLNKLLGTQILVTSDVIDNLPGFLTREIGFFILKGKAQSVHVYELISRMDSVNFKQALLTDFATALKYFQRQQWTKALVKWTEIEKANPNDGPTHFYLQFLKQNLHLVSVKILGESQGAVITIGNITYPLLFGEE